MKDKLVIVLLLFIALPVIHAEVKLPSIFSDHMVLQQQTKVKLWGSSKGKGRVEVITSWNSKRYQAPISNNGRWEVWVETGKAGGPYNIIFDDGDQTLLTDVYLGEVWLCSGQSNMEMPIKGYVGQPVEYSIEITANALKRIPIRLFTVEKVSSKTPLEDCQGSWGLNTSENVTNFSATAYFFGLQLYKSLNVPIGLINASWGGSTIQSWMSSESLQSYTSISQEHLNKDVQVNNAHLLASMLYNGMIYPIKDFIYRGVIWYQGESNIENSSLYESLFLDFVKDWRFQFKNDTLPFYYVQIAPYAYEDKNAVGSALLRQAQYNCEKKISNVGMVVTMDIGNETCIHPSQKKEVGDRLAYLALAYTYEKKGIFAYSPRYVSHKIKGNRIVLSFERVPMGLTSFYKPLQCFQIAGKDGQYHQAKARIVNGSEVEVWNEEIQEPVSVRYAFKNFVKGDLFGVNGLPVSSFTTELNMQDASKTN